MPGSQLNKSYFIDVDHVYGWGNMSYFTYLSEFNRSWRGIAYVEAAVFIVLFVLATSGNILIIGFICKSKRVINITDIFVANLALADILFACSAPFVASIRITENWRLGAAMCSVLCYEMFLCSYVTLWTMAVISIDRYICINLTPTKRMSRKHARFICIGTWVFSAAVFVPLSIFFDLKEVQTENGDVTFCTLLWPKSSINPSLMFIILLLVTAFAFPLVVTVTNYARILKKFWKSKRAVEQSMSNTQANLESGMSRRKRNVHIVNTLVILVVLFVLMWAPVFLSFVVIQYDLRNSKSDVSSSVLIWAIAVAYLNACINPFLYGAINTDIQRSPLCCCKSQITNGRIAAISNAEM